MVNKPHYYLEAEGEISNEPGAYPLEEWPCTIGRGSDCQLMLDFDRISRRHARFEKLDNGLQVTDLGSTNGTFVNHTRIDGPTRLNDGDTIHFADHGFVLRHRDPSGQTVPRPGHTESRGSTDTVIGFTAAPTGFPVQAPEFFEMLNDELIGATRQIMTTGRGTVLAHALRGRSTHPRLGADSATLTRLSEDLGEELRLVQLVRRIALEQADQADLQTDLFLNVHPIECEQPEVLVEDLQNARKRFRHLALVCELPFDSLTRSPHAKNLPARISELGLEVCAVNLTPEDDPANIPGPVSHVCVCASHGPETVELMVKRWHEHASVLVDDIEDPELVDRFFQAGAALFRGPAIGAARDIDP